MARICIIFWGMSQSFTGKIKKKVWQALIPESKQVLNEETSTL